MQPNSKRTITALAGVGSIAALALLAMFLVWWARPTQPTESSQPSSDATATTADSKQSQATPEDAATLRKPDAPREARGKNVRQRRAPRESRKGSLAIERTPQDDTTIVPVVPSSTAAVEDVADSHVPLSETAESTDHQSVIATPPVPEEILPVLPGKSYVSSHMSGRASTLLAEIGAQGAGLKLNAETLGTFTWNPQYSWQSHAFYLQRVKDHINAVGERLAELQQIRHAVLPWQLQAITEVTSHAAQVAASTQAAIIHLRDNQNRLFVSEYRDHLRTIADRSDDMKETADKYLDYEKTHEKFQQLQDELEL